MDARDDLLDLVLAFSNDQVKYLANWIIAYDEASDRHEREARLEKTIYRNRFRRMAEAFEAAPRRERPGLDTELFDFYSRYIGATVPNASRKGLDELCYASRWREAADLLGDIDREAEADLHAQEYERLVTDPGHLIGRIVRVMRREYAKRLDDTRTALKAYVEPHRTALDRLGENLREAREARARLDSSGLSPEDRDAIARELDGRISMMEGMRARELDNLGSARSFLDEVQRASRRFDALVASMQRKLDEIGERKRYLGLASKFEIETSEIDELFKDMKGGLDRDMARIRESFALLEGAFRNGVADAIGDQEKMTRILEPEEDEAAAEPGEAGDRDRYEEILRILKTISG